MESPRDWALQLCPEFFDMHFDMSVEMKSPKKLGIATFL